MYENLELCTVKMNVEITFTYDRNRHGVDTAMQIAESLAINPNFHTIEEGVQVVEVKTSNQRI